jgi:hypothetical protein
LLKLNPPPFNNLHHTYQTHPNKTTNHQTIIKHLTINLPLIYLNLKQTTTKNKNPKHHTFKNPITKKKAVHYRLESPSFNPYKLNKTINNLTHNKIKNNLLKKNNKLFNNYTKKH